MEGSSLDTQPVEHTEVLPDVNYPFLNHSAATLPHNLPPNVDDKPLARQKRKRTSPEDQAVLEAAYKRDPKPDKAARLELVSQVALGEKEVQIWFQNRRQSSRRKSRPLLPHEIAQYQLSRTGESSSPLPSDPIGGSSSGCGRPETQGGVDEGLDASFRSEEGPGPVTEAHVRSRESDPSTADRPTTDVDPTDVGYAATALERPAVTSRTPGTLYGQGHQLGYLANRRSAPSLRAGQMEPAMSHTARTMAAQAADSASRLRKSSSFVRLSMSFEGNASVVTKDGSSPSPPRASQVSVFSMNSNEDPQPQPALNNEPDGLAARRDLQRSSSGRSRDSRTWEFWCDKEARSELEEKAEKDANGSAADAIGLLRSASGRSILGAIPAKRNSLLFRQPTDSKRQKLHAAKLPLQRSSTSSGRLQAGPRANKAKPKLKYSESAVSVYIPGNDSDKENWSPDRDLDPNRGLDVDTLASNHSGPKRSVLEDSSQHGNRGPQSISEAHSSKAFADRGADSENADPEADPELAAFMRSGRKSNSMSSEDDMDCVQGLLSLSQGNWR